MYDKGALGNAVIYEATYVIAFGDVGGTVMVDRPFG